MHISRPNLYDYLKVIAIVTMIIDHIWFLFFPGLGVLRVVWRVAFPLFLFLVWYNHSYTHTYVLRLSGIVLQIGLWIWWYYGWTDMWYINILLAIWLTRYLMIYIQKRNILRWEIAIYICCLGVAGMTYKYIDYGTLSIVFALLGYRVRKYGNNRYVIFAIFVSVSYHMLFMYIVRGFDSDVLWLIFVWFFLYISMYMMSNRNYPLVSECRRYDKLLLLISKNALLIYILQSLILTLMFVFSFL